MRIVCKWPVAPVTLNLSANSFPLVDCRSARCAFVDTFHTQTQTHTRYEWKTNQTHGRSQKFTKKNSLHTRSSVNTWTHEHALTPMMMNEKVERVRISSPTIFFSSFLGFPLRRNDRPTFYFSLSLFLFGAVAHSFFLFFLSLI